MRHQSDEGDEEHGVRHVALLGRHAAEARREVGVSRAAAAHAADDGTVEHAPRVQLATHFHVCVDYSVDKRQIE